MAIVKVKPTSARAAVAWSRWCTSTCTRVRRKPRCSSRRSRRLRPKQQRGVITMRHKGGGQQAPLPCGRLRAQQGRDSGQGRTHRVRPEPLGPHRAAGATPTARSRYVIAPRGVEAGAKLLISGAEAPIKAGNTLPIRNIPVGSTIHCVEMAARQGRADCAFGRCDVGDADGARGHLRAAAVAFG